jgi:hypothetical protein
MEKPATPASLKDRFWTQATRTDVLISLGSFIVSTGLLSWTAQRWAELTGGSWPASIFLGLGASCLLVLVASVYLVAFRHFKPLPPMAALPLPPSKPTTSSSPANVVAATNPQTDRDFRQMMDFLVFQSTILMLDNLLKLAPNDMSAGPLQIGGDFLPKNAEAQEFIQIIRDRMDPGTERRAAFERAMDHASNMAERQLEDTPINQRPDGIDHLLLRKWIMAHLQCVHAVGFLQRQRAKAEQTLLNQRPDLLRRYRELNPSS